MCRKIRCDTLGWKFLGSKQGLIGVEDLGETEPEWLANLYGVISSEMISRLILG
jgi:hypothetical protein